MPLPIACEQPETQNNKRKDAALGREPPQTQFRKWTHSPVLFSKNFLKHPSFAMFRKYVNILNDSKRFIVTLMRGIYLCFHHNIEGLLKCTWLKRYLWCRSQLPKMNSFRPVRLYGLGFYKPSGGSLLLANSWFPWLKVYGQGGVLVVRIQAFSPWFQVHLRQVKWTATVEPGPAVRTLHQNAHSSNLSHLATPDMRWPRVEIESSFTPSTQARCRLGWVEEGSGLLQLSLQRHLLCWCLHEPW